MKLLFIAVMTITLTGCYAYLPINYAGNKFCSASDAQKAVITEAFDKNNFQRKWWIGCKDDEQ